MSSTGRGPRLGGPEDFFVTPAWSVWRLFDAWKPVGGLWIEPGAGNGAIIKAANYWHEQHGEPRVEWRACEIREEARADLEALGVSVTIGDYLVEEIQNAEEATLVLGNPPFQDALAFVHRARAQCPKADVALLLRIAFMASEERSSFLRRVTPDLNILPNRPSFANVKRRVRETKGPKAGELKWQTSTTDSADYAWFVWPPGNRSAGTVRVLAQTPEDVRGAHRPPRVVLGTETQAWDEIAAA